MRVEMQALTKRMVVHYNNLLHYNCTINKIQHRDNLTEELLFRKCCEPQLYLASVHTPVDLRNLRIRDRHSERTFGLTFFPDANDSSAS